MLFPQGVVGKTYGAFVVAVNRVGGWGYPRFRRMVRSSCAILALPKAEASSDSPAELTTTGIPDDSACTDAFNLSGEWSDRVCIPPIVDPELGLLRKEASDKS